MSRHPDLEPLLADDDRSIEAADRDALLRHVRECRGCRARVAAEDPLRLFALLALDEVPADKLERLDAGLAAALEGAAAHRR